MTKRLQFDVEILVSDDITPERGAEVLEAMLVDLQQDENYHDVFIIDSVESKDESVMRILDVLDTVEDKHIDSVINAIEEVDE